MLRWSPLLVLFAVGCARGPNVGSDLPLKRVVIYRNGVGYFERAGKVDEERVTFDMQQRMIGDFLASLAIVERGGSSVRSASFPLELEDTETPDAPPQTLRARKLSVPDHPPGRDPKDMRKVVLELDGKEHDLTIGYLAETPVWRPSYRVVIHEDGSADLQAWGIVQNLSGEDWSNVQLSLVAGAPLAFQSTLGNPVVPTRPIVSDQGEIIAAVPQGVTSLDKSREAAVERVGPGEPPPPPAPDAEKEGDYGERYAEDAAYPQDEAAEEANQRVSKKASAAKPVARSARGTAGGLTTPTAGSMAIPVGSVASAPPMAPPPSLSPPRRLADLAAVAVEAGATRYDIPKVVTVPNESASMVLLTSQRVPGEAVFLYSPDPGVAASFSHPFRVARFTNATQGLLERGPIAVFEKGSFLGQGLLEPLPPKAVASVPFALDRSIALTRDQRADQRGARLFRIEASQLYIERDWVTRTVYKVDVGSNRPGKLLVRHVRHPGTRLHNPPPGTDDDAATGTALLPVSLRANSKLELTVEELQSMQTPVDWLDDLADLAVREYLADARAKPEMAKLLRDAWALRDKLRQARDEQNRLVAEQQELERSSSETRLSLRAIEKNAQAADLRAKLTKRLTEVGTRLEQVTKRLIELRLTLSENEVRFRDAIRELRVEVPSAAK